MDRWTSRGSLTDRMVRLSSGPTEDHEFHTMGPEGFELFAQALHGAQDGVFSTNTFGKTGYKQYGADHVAFRRNGAAVEVDVGQSKAYREFEKDGISKAVDAFVLHWDDYWKAKNVRRFVLFVGSNIKTTKAAEEIIVRTLQLAELGISFEVWDATGIYNRLALAPSVVRTHLGLDWFQKLFGNAANPLAEISLEVAKGNLAALNASAFVGQLNKAETARVAQLRQRIRMGEIELVRVEVEAALSPLTVSALVPEVHADFLRLLAAMHIAGATPEQAKAQLDQADALDGGSSARLRAMLCTRMVGPEKTLESEFDATDPDVAEVLAVAQLRLGRENEALVLLQPALANKPSAETSRLAALAHLLSADRDSAVNLARQAVQRDGESRGCLHALALCLFARALSPSFKFAPSDWPTPVDQAMVLATDQARADLNEADGLLRGLAADPTLSEYREMLAWGFAVRACAPWTKPSADEMLAELTETGRLIGPIVVWAFSRGMPLGRAEGKQVIAAERAAAPDDVQLLLIELAIASEDRDRPRARALLEEGREAMIAKDLESYYRYWIGLLDIDDGREVTDGVLEEWPWLALRAAMRIRYKRRRLEKVAAIAERAMKDDGDGRILLVAIQILFDAGRCGTAANYTDALMNRVATAEAVNLAAYVLHRAGLHERALAALERSEVFPGSILPASLRRIAITSKAALGRLIEAARELSDLAAITGAPMDIWTSIGWQLTVGAVSDARELYLTHQDRLGVVGQGHLQLANAVMRTDPKLATDIARKLIAEAPDELVTATFDLANRLRLDDAGARLVKRMQLLGAKGEAGVQILTGIDEVIAKMEEHRERVDRAWDVYQNGHAAVHMLAHLNSIAFAEQYLGNLVDPPVAPNRPSPLQARYGRRYDEAVWPGRREDVSLIVDLSALMTIHGLGLLDVAERAFCPLLVAPNVINAITHLRQKLSPSQPDRLDAVRHLVDLRDRDLLPDPSALSPVDTFRVTWEPDGAEPDSTLNLSRLIETLADQLGAEQMANVRERLAETIRPEPIGPVPPAGATVILDSGVALEMHLAGALEAARERFATAVSAEELDARMIEVTQAERHDRLAGSLEILADRLAAGAKDGTYKFVSFEERAGNEIITRQYFECLRAMEKPGSILWIDDRFTTSVDQPTFPTVSTVEVLAALARYNRMEATAAQAARLRLRAAGWMFMPITGEEIIALVRPCVRKGAIQEDANLEILRRSTAWTVINRRRLQWPLPEQAAAGVKGELPYLLDQGHAVIDALTRIWSDQTLDATDAAVASGWILEKLDMSSTAPAVIAAGDPRSELMIGLHIAHLLTVALQIRPVAKNAKRREAYLSWLWETVISQRLRIYPEILPHIVDTLGRHIAMDPLDDPKLQRFWVGFCGEVINALPLALREPLLSRPDMRRMFELSNEGVMSIPVGQFETTEYLSTLIKIEEGETRILRSAAGKKATFRLERKGDAVTIAVTVGKKRHLVDDWARRMASDDAVVRLGALGDQRNGLDMSPDQLAALNEELQVLGPIERAMRSVNLASEGMTGWYAGLTSDLRQRSPINVDSLMPPDLARCVRRLQLDSAETVQDSQRRTIAAVGLEEAIQRWSGVPIAPGSPFEEALTDLDDDALLALAERIAGGSAAWAKLFLAKALWSRTGTCPELRRVLTRIVFSALDEGRSESEWRCFVACAQFVAGELPSMEGWTGLTNAQRLMVVWSHAGTLTHVLLAAGMKIDGLTEYLVELRLATPRNLLAETTGFGGDAAHPLDVLAERLVLHAAAPLLAEIAQYEDDAAEATDAALMLIMEMRDGVPVPAMSRTYGELLTNDTISSYLAESVCLLLEPLVGAEIPFLSPRLIGFLRDSIDHEDPAIARSGWVGLRAASGHGALPAELADHAREKAATVELLTGEAPLGPDLSVLLAVATVAAMNGWTEFGTRIDEVFDQLREWAEIEGADSRMLLFETAFHRCLLEPDLHARTEMMARIMLELGSRENFRLPAVMATHRFAMAMPGSFAQPFVDTLARLEAL